MRDDGRAPSPSPARHRRIPRPWGPTVAGALGLAVASLVASGATAAPIKLDQADRAVMLDGVPNPGEWPREPQRLDPIGAPTSPADFSARATLAYDAKSVFVGVDVTDDILRPGDEIELVLEVGGKAHSFVFVPGEPGKSAAKVTSAGRPVSGAKAVEAPKKDGWSLEASLPWSSIPGGATQRVALRGALVVRDADRSSAVESTMGWGQTSALLPVWTTPEQALADGLLREKRLGAPAHALSANVVGDALLERVLVHDRYLVVLGPTFRGGTQYYFRDLSVPDKTVSISRIEARDLDGDGRDELVLAKRLTATKAPPPGKSRPFRDHVEVLSFGKSDVPSVLLLAETAVGGEQGAITNPIRISMEAGKGVITIGPATAHQTDAERWAEPVEATIDPAPTPWGRVESRTYKLRATGFVVDAEKTRAEAQPKPAATTQAPKPATPAPPAAPDASKVYEQYKRDRSVRGPATATLTANFSGDGRPEKVALHDRDLVVWGPGFKGGSAYAYTTLGFAKASDVLKLSAVDVTGDGLAEIVVRGVLRAQHGGDEVVREVELVFTVGEQGLKRVFGAELARAIGSKRVEGSVTYAKGKIVLAPGRATGFTRESYPFAQDTAPVGGLEPLLLPWSGASKVEYLHRAGAFERR
jgi:hypothetical protein